MIICTRPNGFCKRCVIDMDAQQSLGGSACCDTAEACGFRREDILSRCEYAEPGDIKDAALKELFS